MPAFRADEHIRKREEFERIYSRNRAKRLVRELFRHHKPAGGFDIVVVPRREMLDASYVILEAEFRALLDRRNQPGRPRHVRPSPGGPRPHSRV
jgi:RNase P protein component